MSIPYAKLENEDTAVITVRFTGNSANDDNFRDYLDKVESLYDREQPISLIFNAEKAVFPKFKYQQRQARWLIEKEGLMRKYCRGTAYVIQQSIIRWALKAIFSLQTQPVPYTIVETQQAAEQWAKEQLAKV